MIGNFFFFWVKIISRAVRESLIQDGLIKMYFKLYGFITFEFKLFF